VTNHTADTSRTEPAERKDGVPGVGVSVSHYDLAKWLGCGGDLRGVDQSPLRGGGGLPNADGCPWADRHRLPGQCSEAGKLGGACCLSEPQIMVITLPPQTPDQTQVLRPVDVAWAMRFKSQFRDVLRQWGKERTTWFLSMHLVTADAEPGDAPGDGARRLLRPRSRLRTARLFG
jgi:hypothetical protein